MAIKTGKEVLAKINKINRLDFYKEINSVRFCFFLQPFVLNLFLFKSVTKSWIFTNFLIEILWHTLKKTKKEKKKAANRDIECFQFVSWLIEMNVILGPPGVMLLNVIRSCPLVDPIGGVSRAQSCSQQRSAWILTPKESQANRTEEPGAQVTLQNLLYFKTVNE